MKQKLILTSIFAISVVGSAYAEPTNTVTGAPTNGSYQADTTYTGAATVEELGVYENNSTATANANYEDILYNISAGNYLASGSEDENGTICPIGSYCPGLTGALYSATENQGINTCPTIDSKTYTTENTGSSSVTACYTEYELACSAVNTQATIGSGHVTGITYANTNATGRRTAISTTEAGAWTLNNASACDITSMTCENGWHYESGSTGLDVDVSVLPTSYRYRAINGSADGSSWDGLELPAGQWITEFSYGTITGQGLCSTTSGTFGEKGTPSETDGQYCWCNVTGYTPASGATQTISSNSWVFNWDYGDTTTCIIGCAGYCAEVLNNDLGFRSTLLSVSSGTSNPSCVANTINITWGDTDATDVSANNAGTVTYGEDIRTPVKAQHKAGKRFTGWTFSKPTTE